MSMKPIFKHDCDECRYLGTTRDAKQVFDWYVHKRDGVLGDDVIARYGDEPSENVTPIWQYAGKPGPFVDGMYAMSTLALVGWALMQLQRQ